MSARLRTALVLAPLFLAVLFFGGRVLFALLLSGVAALGAGEYLDLTRPKAHSVERLFVPAWAAVVVLGFLSPVPALPSALVALGTLFYLAAWMVGPGPSPETLPSWGAALGAWVLVALFLGHGVWVRSVGVSPVVFVALTVWAGDTAAYYIGTAFGSHPLAPAVSPKKSVEGAVASVAASAIVALVSGLLLPLPHSVMASCLLGIGINVAAQAGDLVESLFKRCAGVKDSGNLFPGHGGVLDRVDGFLLSLPFYASFLTIAGAG